MSTSELATPTTSKAASASLALGVLTLLLIPVGIVTDALPVLFAMLFSVMRPSDSVIAAVACGIRQAFWIHAWV